MQGFCHPIWLRNPILGIDWKRQLVNGLIIRFSLCTSVAAKDKNYLRRMGINYVLNTAEGKVFTQVNTDHIYYRDCPSIRYKGFPLMDHPTTDISRYFHIAANFIDEGISSGG